ncbi:hypothetical protein AVEN_86164-1 [Araneus ventricosus]|uniref:Uncharacterized protein n=1 Tax=Araneus ventricosus TaxID=182803 RepID=A0A4Y2DU55_ARAVE|nr:hypothetical protein AVEN_86164-1 [Araneus ventricosus]
MAWLLAHWRIYPIRSIGSGGPVAWPPCSLHPNPLDFFFWGNMKSLIYDTPVDSVEDLVAQTKLTHHQKSWRGCASHSFASVNCATTRVSATLSTCCELFSDQ